MSAPTGQRGARKAKPAAPPPDVAPSPDATPTYFTSRELADYLAIAPGTPGKWRHARHPDQPPFVRLTGRAVRYERAAVLAWLAERTEAAR